MTGRVLFWRPTSCPPDRGSDIAVLKLEQHPPAGSQPGRLVTAEDLWEHTCRAFGFPGGYDNGVWAAGILRDKQANGWVVIEGVREINFFVEPGFSGTPVWDNQVGGIVDMVAATETIPNIKAAYIIPSSLLINICPELGRQAIPPCPYRGLNAFREKDAPFFFGREAFTEKLAAEVHRKPLVAVIGPSGRGKSSVIFAGLIPALRAEELWLTAFGGNPCRCLRKI